MSLADLRAFTDTYVLPFGLRLLMALVIFVIGRWIAKMLLRLFNRGLSKSRMDASLQKFLGDILYAAMFSVVALASLDSLGVKTTAVVAVLGAAGIAVGLALQGTLSNFAAGVMLILMRPYKIGDLVAIGKYVARVDSIRLFSTVLVTADSREVSIPNGQIIAQPIENLTVLGRRRIDLVVTINQPTELPKIKDAIAAALKDDRVFEDPVAGVELTEVTDASAKLFVRPWTSNADYSKVQVETIEKIKQALEGAGVKFAITTAVPSP